MNKKVSKALVATLVLGTMVPATFASAASFTDINNSYAKDAITRLAELGVINGKDDTHFDPQGAVTRAEFVKILVRSLNLPTSTHSASFTDTQGHWASNFIETAIEAGIINGVGDGLFDPNGIVNREQAATMLVRALQTKGLESNGTTTNFADFYQISDWAKPFIELAQKYNLVKGDGVNFNPRQNATREQAVILTENILRAIDQLKKEYKITPENVTMNVGESKEFKVNGGGTYNTVAWSVSGNGTIDQNGKFTATSAGTATISALIDGAKTVTSTVTVNAVVAPPSGGGGGGGGSTNHAPIVQSQIPDFVDNIAVGRMVTVAELNKGITDPDNDALTFTATVGDIADNKWTYKIPAKYRGQTFPVTITATDTHGATASVTFHIKVIDAPSLIENLAVTSKDSKPDEVGGIQNTLKWDAYTEADFHNYVVYRGDNETMDKLIVSKPQTGTELVDKDVIPGKIYYYQVVVESAEIDTQYNLPKIVAMTQRVPVTTAIEAALTSTNATGIHDEKVYEQFKLTTGEGDTLKPINLDKYNVTSISVTKPNGTTQTLTTDTDPTLWFNAQNEKGKYRYTIVATDGNTYYATIDWAGSVEATATVNTPLSVSYNPDRNTSYTAYKLLNKDGTEVDLVGFKKMYEVKQPAQGSLPTLSLNPVGNDNTLYLSADKAEGKYTYLVKNSDDTWTRSVLQVNAPTEIPTSARTVTKTDTVNGFDFKVMETANTYKLMIKPIDDTTITNPLADLRINVLAKDDTNNSTFYYGAFVVNGVGTKDGMGNINQPLKLDKDGWYYMHISKEKYKNGFGVIAGVGVKTAGSTEINWLHGKEGSPDFSAADFVSVYDPSVTTTPAQ